MAAPAGRVSRRLQQAVAGGAADDGAWLRYGAPGARSPGVVPSDWLVVGVRMPNEDPVLLDVDSEVLFGLLPEWAESPRFPMQLAQKVERERSALLVAVANWTLCPTVVPAGYVLGVWETSAMAKDTVGKSVVFTRVRHHSGHGGMALE